MAGFDAWLTEITEQIRDKRMALEDPVCAKCEGGGWEMHGLGHSDPHFHECPECGNPRDLPSP